MATRKRTAKKTTKRSNSNVAAAQQATRNNRARQAAKRARAGGTTPKEDPSKKAPPATPVDPKLKAAQEAADPRRLLTKSTLEQNHKPGEKLNSSEEAFKAATGEAQKIAGQIPGLTSGVMQERQRATAEKGKGSLLANPALFGGPTPQTIGARLTALRNEQTALQTKKLRDAGGAVFLGTKKQQIRREIRGGDFEGGQNRTPEAIAVDDIRSSDELMSWLADEKTFNQIRDAAKKSGIDVQSYDDVAKIWESVVKQAAATYSTTGKKVTPWALLQLRGKTMVNGRPAAKTTTSTSIDEMDPAQAKVMVKNSLQQMLGRDPRQDEIDDFISKAQMIAKQNPNVTTTTTQYDVAGDPVSQSSVSKGGGDVVTAKAQLEAERLAKEAPDYKDYQAAGVLMPWFNEALASPF